MEPSLSVDVEGDEPADDAPAGIPQDIPQQLSMATIATRGGDGRPASAGAH